MEDPHGCPSTQESPKAVIFSEGIVHFSTTKSFLILVPNKKMFTTKNLLFCCSQAQMALLSHNFFLLRMFVCTCRGLDDNLEILFFEL